MSWPRATEHPEPENVEAGLRHPSRLRRVCNRLPGIHRGAAIRGFLDSNLRSPRGIVSSRGAIATLSGLLVVAVLFLHTAGPNPAPGPEVYSSPDGAAPTPTTASREYGRSATAAVSTPTPKATPTAAKRPPTPTAETAKPQPNPTSSPSPTEAPRIVASSRGSRPTPDISTNEKFIVAVAECAQESQLDSKVPSSVTIAQAILESDWGRSQLAKKAQNYFGIKATSGPGPAGIIRMSTWEVIAGANVTVTDGFKAYHNLWESVMDHGRFLADNKRYAAAFKFLDNPVEFARQIHLAGYATDPAYTTKLVNLINRFNLTQYDLKP